MMLRMRARSSTLALLLALAAGERWASAQPPAPLAGYGGAPVKEGWLAGAGDARIFYRAVGRARA